MVPTASAFADGLKLDQITASLLKGIQETGKKRVAVFDFTDLDGNTSLLGKYVAEELSVELTQSANGIEVVDRSHLSAILREHKMSEQGLTDPATAKQLGQFTGADVIVTGSLTNVGDAVLIVAKALSTDSARIIGASSGTLPMSSEISILLKNANSPSAAGDRSTPTPEGISENVQSQEPSHWAETFKSKCAMCHGLDGLATTSMATMLKVPSFKSPDLVKAPDSQLIDATKNGKGKMPAYNGKLTDAQIKDLVAYIRTLQK